MELTINGLNYEVNAQSQRTQFAEVWIEGAPNWPAIRSLIKAPWLRWHEERP